MYRKIVSQEINFYKINVYMIFRFVITNHATNFLSLHKCQYRILNYNT
jgi:hypothetical protein